ncbi:MAG: ATP-binding protein [Deltaproteobacteria bacterium]|nr:ATP-binding protein [Deltaproteobacteria bacterium]
MNEELKDMLLYLRLKGLLSNWDHLLKTAGEKEHSHTRLLKTVIEEEFAIKKENARKLRLQKAKIPERLVLETFPFERQPQLNKRKIIEIYDALDYITKQQNIVWIGTTGTGKTGLATALLINAINQGYSGRFILFPDLIELLYQSIADGSEGKIIKKFAAYDCLLIDELGYVEIEPVQVGLFFTLMHKRHKKKSTLITSNLAFSKWTGFLKNDQLTAALIDRLTENSHVINMKDCKSLRPKLASK